MYSGLRPKEARSLLKVLDPAESKRRHSYLDNADNINWVALAMATYRDFGANSGGMKPDVTVLDTVLSCLRLQYKPQRGVDGTMNNHNQQQQATPAGGGAPQQQFIRDLQREFDTMQAKHGKERPYETPFDKRAMDMLNEAISQGILPSYAQVSLQLPGAAGSVDIMRMHVKLGSTVYHRLPIFRAVLLLCVFP